MGKAILILLFMIAVILRFAFLGRMSFWADELVTIGWVGPLHTCKDIIHFIFTSRDQAPPLFPLLLHGWVKLSGIEGGYPSEAWIRILPVLIGLFCLIFLIRIFVFPWQGLVSIGTFIIFCFSSFYLYFSREIRPYGFLLLMTLLSTWIFLRLFERDKKFDRFLYSLSMLFGVLTNPFMWLVFISHCVYLLILKDKKKFYGIIKLAIPSIATYIPYAFILLRQYKFYGCPPLFSVFMARKTAGLFFHSTLGFNFPTNIVPERYNLLLQHPLFLLSLASILFVWGLSLIKLPRVCREDRLALLSFIHVIVPVILVFFIYPGRLSPRPLVIIAPFFHYLLIRGIFFKRPSQFARSAGIVFLALTIFFGFRFITLRINPYFSEDWKGLARELRYNDDDKTLVFIDDVESMYLKYYLKPFTRAEVVTYKFGAEKMEMSQDVNSFDKVLFIKQNTGKHSLYQDKWKVFLEDLCSRRIIEVKEFGRRLDLWIAIDK